MIFTPKSIIYTCIFGVIGLIPFYMFGALGIKILRWIFLFVFAAIGFAIGTFKIPDTNSMEITRKLGGEQIDKAFIRWLKFKRKGNVIYTYLGTKEENENE